jgi:hypothetical protein
LNDTLRRVPISWSKLRISATEVSTVSPAQQANSQHLELPRLCVRQDDAVALEQEVFTQRVRQNGQVSVKGFHKHLLLTQAALNCDVLSASPRLSRLESWVSISCSALGALGKLNWLSKPL